MPSAILATAATIIASQAVISGVYSMTRQAVQLGFLPPMEVRHTSQRRAGQIYMPAANWAVFAGVLALVLGFESSSRLADAYGIAVTGTFLTTTCMLVVLARVKWHWPTWKLVLMTILFAGLELSFFAGNVVKVVHGGWVPLGIAAAVFTLMTTWRRGRQRVVTRLVETEGTLHDFLAELAGRDVLRVPGTAVVPHPSDETVPLALRVNLEQDNALHQHVIIVSAGARQLAHIAPDDQVRATDIGPAAEGIVHLDLRYGFFDRPDIPAALAHAATTEPALADTEVDNATYYVSRAILTIGRRRGMATWRKHLFLLLARNAADPALTFALLPTAPSSLEPKSRSDMGIPRLHVLVERSGRSCPHAGQGPDVSGVEGNGLRLPDYYSPRPATFIATSGAQALAMSEVRYSLGEIWRAHAEQNRQDLPVEFRLRLPSGGFRRQRRKPQATSPVSSFKSSKPFSRLATIPRTGVGHLADGLAVVALRP